LRKKPRVFFSCIIVLASKAHRGCWAQVQNMPVADLGIVYMILVLQELGGHGSFHWDVKGKPGRPISVWQDQSF
jgi:hypothetical protein